jgi:hypothetical protein
MIYLGLIYLSASFGVVYLFGSMCKSMAGEEQERGI